MQAVRINRVYLGDTRLTIIAMAAYLFPGIQRINKDVPDYFQGFWRFDN